MLLDNVGAISGDFDATKQGRVVRLPQGGGQRGGRRRYDDKIELSPFAEYLTEIGWGLKLVAFEDESTLLFDFYLDDYEFRTKTDFDDFPKEPRQTFKIVADVAVGNDLHRALLKTSVAKSGFPPNRKYVKPEDGLEALPKLFTNAVAAGVGAEISKEHTAALDHLTDRIEDDLFDELRNVSAGLYRIFEKLGKIDLATIDFPEDDRKRVEIEKASAVRLGEAPPEEEDEGEDSLGDVADELEETNDDE
jgi:hypothetical protein